MPPPPEWASTPLPPPDTFFTLPRKTTCKMAPGGMGVAPGVPGVTRMDAFPPTGGIMRNTSNRHLSKSNNSLDRLRKSSSHIESIV